MWVREGCVSLSIGQCVGPAGWKCVKKKKIDVFVCFLALRAEAFDLCTVRTLAELDPFKPVSVASAYFEVTWMWVNRAVAFLFSVNKFIIGCEFLFYIYVFGCGVDKSWSWQCIFIITVAVQFILSHVHSQCPFPGMDLINGLLNLFIKMAKWAWFCVACPPSTPLSGAF